MTNAEEKRIIKEFLPKYYYSIFCNHKNPEVNLKFQKIKR